MYPESQETVQVSLMLFPVHEVLPCSGAFSPGHVPSVREDLVNMNFIDPGRTNFIYGITTGPRIKSNRSYHWLTKNRYFSYKEYFP